MLVDILLLMVVKKPVLIQERAAENRVYCFNVKRGNNKWSWMAEIKSVPDYKSISPKQINIMIATRNNGLGIISTCRFRVLKIRFLSLYYFEPWVLFQIKKSVKLLS